MEGMFDVFDEETTSTKKAKYNGQESSKEGQSSEEGQSAEEGQSSKFENLIMRKQKFEMEHNVILETKKINEAVTEEITLMEEMPRVTVHRIETREACTHEVALPPNFEFQPLKAPSGKPAKTYPFVLDAFQSEAILCLENLESVLVSAHTSAGKTVVAEYAIAMSLRDRQRVIYTSPIKALSNQKYRELQEEFQDVGLMTGDATINPTASCLVMTTEIFRSMLYRGSEIVREVAWVVFDEIHYMRDPERGVVWEETLILPPDNVHYVFLSATIPNASQFAEWIAHLHSQPCHVVYTEFRPTPLQHYVYPAGGSGIHMVVNEAGEFLEENFNRAMAVLREAGGAASGKPERGRKGGSKGESDCYNVVKMILEKDLAPAIIFSFSKKDCELHAMDLAKLNFNTGEEEKSVQLIYENAIDSLSDDDKRLPQVEHILPLLKRGIGVHHSGLLPLLKETVEILFGEGLIKTLFATETFAMGLNMPARTVLFTSPRKFDGKEFRWLTSGEYIQMSGRAGRRGIDTRGIVIFMVNEMITPATGRQILKGQADSLNSAFHLSYNMVLNLLRVEGINPEFMLKRSFYQFQNFGHIPALTDKLLSLEKEIGAIKIPEEETVAVYFKLRQQLENLTEQMRDFLRKPRHILPFLQPGRLLHIKNGASDYGWSPVINFQKKKKENKDLFIVEVLLHVSSESASSTVLSSIYPCSSVDKGSMVVVPVLLDLVQNVSSLRIYLPRDLRSSDSRMAVLKSIGEIKKRFPDGLPRLDPLEDMKIKNQGFSEVVKKIEIFESRMFSHKLHDDPHKAALYRQYEGKVKLQRELHRCKEELKEKRSLLQMNDLRCRKRVLRRMDYINSTDVIQTKGRIACEINSVDELLVTELLFNGVFNELSPAQACALLSCFVLQEKCNDMPKLTDDLAGALRQMQETARRIAKISIEAKMDFSSEDEYVDTFKVNIMDLVYQWCQGASFVQLMKMTDMMEGSIIRCMRRLEESLRQMCLAAKSIGNVELENKFSQGIKLIKRDIVFAASLYL